MTAPLGIVHYGLAPKCLANESLRLVQNSGIKLNVKVL